MRYGVQIKFVEFGGSVIEKELATNNTRAGNLLFDTHKAYADTMAVKLIDKSTGEIIRQWVRA
jgi:uncharacterized FlaG/YvyC family protein